MITRRVWGIVAICSLLPIGSFGQVDSGPMTVGAMPPALHVRLFQSQDSIQWDGLKNRVVVVEFWATWCQPCLQNIPKLDSLVNEYAGKAVTFLSVTYEPDGMVKKFLAQHPMHTMIGIDNDFATFRAFKAWGIPMTVVVNSEGKIACVIHPNKLTRALLDEVLAGRTPAVEPARPWTDPAGAEAYFRSLITKSEK